MKLLMFFRRAVVALVLTALLIVPANRLVSAATTNYAFSVNKDVIITEIQTSTLHSAGEEFIELFNNTANDIDLADTAHSGKDAWKIQYFSKTKLSTLLPNSASASGWTSPFRTISLTGTIPAGDYYVLAAEGYVPGSIDPDQTYSSTLADDGGAIQLVDAAVSGTTTSFGIHDRLAWSTDPALPANPLLYPSPGAGASLQRQPNEDDAYLSADGTLTNFATATVITPKNVWQPPLPADDPTPPEDTSDDDTGGTTPSDPVETTPTPSSNDGLASPVVTELLPNPASPQTDEANEYIELYNPNDTVFNLNGYTMETGTTTLHDFTFTEDVLLQPGEYRAFYSSETNLSLSNTSGQVRLLDTNASVVAQSDSYTAAADGMAWALDPTDGLWKWSTTTSPNGPNTVTTPIVAAKATKTTKVKTAVAKKTTAKVKGASTTKKAKTTKAKVAASAVAHSALAPTTAPIHLQVLVAVAVLAVGYGVYEYRKDIANRYFQFRSHREVRRAARK